jgi:membrane-bound serine protease (ClpP class)
VTKLHFIHVIRPPDFALILTALGALGVYTEFLLPGRIAPGVIGATLVLLGLASFAAYPIDPRGTALIVAAFACFLLEARFALRGTLTAAGAASLFAGLLFLVDSPDPRMRIHWLTAALLAVPFSAVTSFLLKVALRARRNKLFAQHSAE